MSSRGDEAISVWKFLCNDKRCQGEIYFLRMETTALCFRCGQRWERSSLLGMKEGSIYNNREVVQYIKNCQFVPERGTEMVKVLGLSNYYCKLLSPLLTTYGMDKTTGQAKLLKEMDHGDIFDCSSFGDLAFLIEPEHISIPGFGRDITGSMDYLADTLLLIKEFNGDEERLLPIHADGDGHCLVHAISRALVGRELFWHPLRCSLKRHFEYNLDKFKELFKDFVDMTEWPSIIDECDPTYLPPDNEPHGLRNIHVFGLANVLRRPIILLDSLECMNKSGDYSALFLPGFIGPDGCKGKDNTLNKPICIAWSSLSHNHYIPLVGIQNIPLPVLPRSLVPKVWGLPQSVITSYMEFDDNDNCIIGGSRSLSENYLQRLVWSMEGQFYAIHAVHPTLVADTKFFLCEDNVAISTPSEIVTCKARSIVTECRLFRCLTCTAICECPTDLTWFHRGGFLYNILLQGHKRLINGVTYEIPVRHSNNCYTCKYDSLNDVLLPVSYKMRKCVVCKSNTLIRLRPDGSLDGEPTNIPIQGIKSSLNSRQSSSQADDLKINPLTRLRPDGSLVGEPANIPIQGVKSSLNSRQSSSQADDPKINPLTRLRPDGSLVGEPANIPIQGVKSSLNSRQSSSQADDPKMARIKVQYAGVTAEDVIPDSQLVFFAESHEVAVSQIMFGFIEKHFPKEIDNIQFQNFVAEAIDESIKKYSAAIPTSFKPDQIQEDKSNNSSEEKATVEEPTFSGTSNTDQPNSSKCEPWFVKVVSPTGKLARIKLPETGISYDQLQEWIKNLFCIPIPNQRIKMGFPPKELEAPLGNESQALPLKHGDRLVVENCPRQDTKRFTSTPYIRNNARDCLYLNRLTDSSSDLLWNLAKLTPNEFRKGGLYYEELNKAHILCDLVHVRLDTFPTKTFSYNVYSDSIELCVKPLGHFEISEDLNSKIEQVQAGESVQGYRECPVMSLMPGKKDLIINRTSKMNVTPTTTAQTSTEPHLPPLLRKGPGFSVLSSQGPSDDMDIV